MSESFERARHADIGRRINEVYGSLSPQLKRAARYVADHPQNVAMHSMRRIAREAKVPPSTMTRLAQALEFDGYETLRNQFRDLVVGEGGFARRASRLQSERSEPASGAGLLERYAAAAVRNIEADAAAIGETELDAAAQLLLSSKRVVAAGMLSSFSLAGYAYYMASMALPGWSLLRPHGGSYADQINDIGPEDALLVIATEPYASGAVDAARWTREHGGRVVAVTDSRLSPVARLADCTLVCSTQGPHFFPTHASALVALEALVGCVIVGAGDDAVRRLGDVEKMRRGFGEYWTEDE
ncbi:MAG: MurR/RpiR family transcriptional regulator [Hyphomicrobiales bacterium]